MVKKVRKSREAKIVVIGGGTGLSILLRGLKKYTSNITAIVSVADDGGGSGVLREDLGMLPPGDIRACLLALANTEPTMEKLLQYRFDTGSLNGQSFGNLFLAAMNGIYGSFEMAIKEASNVLAITGKVYPMTLESVQLHAKLENGSSVIGESNIPKVVLSEGSKIDHVFIEPNKVSPLKEGIKAIEEADLIVFGPGSLYTSVIPNLLIDEIPERIHKSEAKKVFISNIMTQPGETDGFNIVDHLNVFLKHSMEGIVDYIIINKGKVPFESLEKYSIDGSEPVLFDEFQRSILLNKRIEAIEEDLVEVKKDYIRHDNDKLSRLLIKLARKKD